MEVDDLYAESVMAFKSHIELTRESLKNLWSVRRLRKDAVEADPEKRKQINKLASTIIVKQIGWCMGLVLSVIPLTVLFSLNALVHYLGLWQTVAILGSAAGTTSWVFFLDRTSAAAFATANLFGIMVVAAVALTLALTSPINDDN